jgi:hypothetical protein
MKFNLFHPRIIQCLAVACAAIRVVAPAPSVKADTVRIRWVPLERARLTLDDKIPLKWNVYAPEKQEKKKDPTTLLILLGRRYIALDTKARLAYTVLPSDLKPQGVNFESDPLTNPDRLLPTSDWTIRDVGPALLVRFTLGDYGRDLEVQLPHVLDLRLSR